MYFFTATINSWKHLLQEDALKQILLDSFSWFHSNNRAAINGFVVMPNHFHLLWTPMVGYQKMKNEDALLSFTGHQFRKALEKSDPFLLSQYRSQQADREYQFWERRPRSIEIKSRSIAEQKLVYIHHNPLQEHWGLVSRPEDYRFSSARFYLLNEQSHDFLKHYMDFI
ncbi:MAG: hypothetical protein ABI729_05995 [Chitinophagales bacterium]